MITTDRLTKRFGRTTALAGIDCIIPDGCIYGMVGSNGAGKSTLLRLMAGVYRADSGTLHLDGQPIYDCPESKRQILLTPDELYTSAGTTMQRMARMYTDAYTDFDPLLFASLCSSFRLQPNKPLHAFSKGMRRQASFVLAMSCRTRYLLLDETFDGLDPILRNLTRTLMREAVCERGATVVLTSHSLRELEDSCDQLALLHQGGLVLQSDVGRLKTTLCKVQVVFQPPFDRSRFDGLQLDILRYTQHGSVANLVLRGKHEEVLSKLHTKQPMLCELVPLSLEEVFIHEMEALGYAMGEHAEQRPIQYTAAQMPDWAGDRREAIG